MFPKELMMNPERSDDDMPAAGRLSELVVETVDQVSPVGHAFRFSSPELAGNDSGEPADASVEAADDAVEQADDAATA